MIMKIIIRFFFLRKTSPCWTLISWFFGNHLIKTNRKKKVQNESDQRFSLQFQALIFSPRDNTLSINTPIDCVDFICMPRKIVNKFTTTNIKHFHRRISRGRYKKPRVCTPSSLIYGTNMSSKGMQKSLESEKYMQIKKEQSQSKTKTKTKRNKDNLGDDLDPNPYTSKQERKVQIQKQKRNRRNRRWSWWCYS